MIPFATALRVWVRVALNSFGGPAGQRLRASLSAITTAVVGVVLNLAVWFALYVLFSEVHTFPVPPGVSLLVPAWGTINLPAALISLGAFVALFRFKIEMLPVLGTSTVAGHLFHA